MADFLLANRAQLRRALYRLLSTDGSDDGLTENSEAQGEVGNYLVQHGLWNAQMYMIRVGFREWITNSGALVFDAAAADGTRSVALPADFFRLAGDERRGALLDSQGRSWGQLIDPRLRRGAGGRAYWIENGRLYLGARSQIPGGGLNIEYHYRHPALESDDAAADPLDFPEQWRPLIPAEGAAIGVHEGWFPKGPEDEVKVLRSQDYWHRTAATWIRTSQEPQKLRPPEVLGSRIFV